MKNRLIKAAKSDSLGDGRGNATKTQARLYERWAEGGAALSIIGEVQVTAEFPEKPGNLVLAPGADLTALTTLASRGSAGGAQIWPQLGHAGALSHPPISDPTAPSPLGVEGLNSKGMTPGDIAALPDAYARAADMAKKAGFGGVQIHAGHGFLFSQFLSPLFNHRTDAYGGPVAARFRVIGETIEAVRKAVGPAFPYGIRINATDKLEGGFKTREEALVAMSAGAADAIGLARAMALNPSLANSWLSDAGCDPDHPRFAQTVPGGVTAWYSMRLTALGEDREGAFDQDLPAALQDDDARDARRCVSWRARLS